MDVSVPRNGESPLNACMRDARCRVAIERVEPEIDAGRFPIKRVVGERVVVEADVFADGHDELACVLCYREAESSEWREVPMTPLVNDRCRGGLG
jgi:starch synthase (maltosyl-transferring)